MSIVVEVRRCEMSLKYNCEQAYGANARLSSFSFFDACETLAQARESVRRRILRHIDFEDRGEDYEREWRRLADDAKTAEPGDILTFDERHWRIVEES